MRTGSERYSDLIQNFEKTSLESLFKKNTEKNIIEGTKLPTLNS